MSDISKVTPQFYGELEDMMGSHPKTRTYTASDFSTTKAFVIPPASQVAYREYQPYVFVSQATGTNDQFKANATFVDGAAKTAMNTLIVEFNATDGVNNYDLALHSQDACRFAANTLYSHLARETTGGLSEEAFARNVRGAQQMAGHALASADRDSVG